MHYALEVAVRLNALPLRFTNHKLLPISWETQPQVGRTLGCQLACLLRGLPGLPVPTMSLSLAHQNVGRLSCRTSPPGLVITAITDDWDSLLVDHQVAFRDWRQD